MIFQGHYLKQSHNSKPEEKNSENSGLSLNVASIVIL